MNNQQYQQAAGLELLNALWRTPTSYHQFVTTDRRVQPIRFAHHMVTDLADSMSSANTWSESGKDCYFACAEYKTSESRKADNVAGAWAFWMDIDCGIGKQAEGKGYETIDRANQALDGFCLAINLPEPTHRVQSGGGLHAYWALDKFLGVEDWKQTARQLKELHIELKFLADSSRTADAASILRLPGTLNHKLDTARPVALIKTETGPSTLSCALVIEAIRSAYAKHKGHSLLPNIPNIQIHSEVTLEKLKRTLDAISPDCSYDDWVRVLMAIHTETGGSDEGLLLAVEWSANGKSFSGNQIIGNKWKGFGQNTSSLVGIGTLLKMVQDSEQFISVPTVVCGGVVEVTDRASIPVNVAAHPLAVYSLRGSADQLEKEMVEQVPILGRIAPFGQATVIYASPNTGKTLLTIHLLCDAIERKVIDPSKIYYLNMDDNGKGLVEKLRIADLHGFHMLAQGHKNFHAKLFPQKLLDMTEGGWAKGVVVVLDTLKKFTDLMNKGSSSEFSNLVRGFVMKGGTVIALAHTNKNPGLDGKPIYGGTTDIVDDFDCAYTLSTVPGQQGDSIRVVEFDNFKSRGCVEKSVAYSYSRHPFTNYSELIESIGEVEAHQLEPMREAAAQVVESPLIEALKASITEGNLNKMDIVKEVSKHTGVSRNRVTALLDKYTGTERGRHLWSVTNGRHGAKSFELLQAGDQKT